MIHDPPSKIAESFKRRAAFAQIHAAADARGGAPVDQACASVQAYMDQKRSHCALDELHRQVAFSAISAGMDFIDRGEVTRGLRMVLNACAFLADRAAEVRS